MTMLGNRRYRNSFKNSLIFLENNKNGFFCFRCVTKTNQDKIAFQFERSQCGQVVKPSGLCSAIAAL